MKLQTRQDALKINRQASDNDERRVLARRVIRV
jgi:hypothetical protein